MGVSAMTFGLGRIPMAPSRVPTTEKGRGRTVQEREQSGSAFHASARRHHNAWWNLSCLSSSCPNLIVWENLRYPGQRLARTLRTLLRQSGGVKTARWVFQAAAAASSSLAVFSGSQRSTGAAPDRQSEDGPAAVRHRQHLLIGPILLRLLALSVRRLGGLLFPHKPDGLQP